MEIKEEYKTEYNEKIKSIHFEIESAIIDYYSLCKIGDITNAFKYNKLTIFCTKDSLTCLETIIQCLKNVSHQPNINLPFLNLQLTLLKLLYKLKG